MSWQRLVEHGRWTGGEISHREEKLAVAERLAARVQDGETLGVGSGSTAYLAVQAIGARVARESLRVVAIPTSYEVALTCAAVGLPTASLVERRPDWGFDGADEVDPEGSLIKGRGGALLREKLVMASQARTVILADRSKLVAQLGSKFPIPIETHPLALSLVEERLYALGATAVRLRSAGGGKDGPAVTESGNLLFDATFSPVPATLERDLKAIPGVMETGLFQGYAVEVMTP